MLPVLNKNTFKHLAVSGGRHHSQCIFVLSTGRCGTTTLSSLFSLKNCIDARHEPLPLLLNETTTAYDCHPVSTQLGRELFYAFATTRTRPILRAARPGRYYAECSNRLTFLAPVLAMYLPRAKFIHLYRHPADFVRSGMRRGYYQRIKGGWDRNRLVPSPTSDAARSWDAWSPFQKTCWLWNAVNEFSLDFAGSVPANRLFSLSAEALFSNRDDVLDSLFAWLGVQPPTAAEIALILATPENVQQANHFPRWPDWTSDQRRILLQQAGQVAARLGYHDLAAESIGAG